MKNNIIFFAYIHLFLLIWLVYCPDLIISMNYANIDVVFLLILSFQDFCISINPSLSIRFYTNVYYPSYSIFVYMTSNTSNTAVCSALDDVIIWSPFLDMVRIQ